MKDLFSLALHSFLAVIVLQALLWQAVGTVGIWHPLWRLEAAVKLFSFGNTAVRMIHLSICFTISRDCIFCFLLSSVCQVCCRDSPVDFVRMKIPLQFFG